MHYDIVGLPGAIYRIAAEVSYIIRWVALKSIRLTLAIMPLRHHHRERLVIHIGNVIFDEAVPRKAYDSFEAYVNLQDSSLDRFLNLLPRDQWLVGRDVLDLGSGLGQYAQQLLEHGAASVMALEYQENKSRWSAAHSHSPQLQFVVGSAEAMPFEDASFDTVFSHTVFEHITDVEAALREVRRVLRPDGVALISYNFFHHRGGHHLFPYIHFPWATWVVDETYLCEYWSERLAHDQDNGLMRFYEQGAQIQSLNEGAEIHLNRLTYDEFELLLGRSKLKIQNRRTSEQLARCLPWLLRVPRLRYFMAGTFYYVLSPISVSDFSRKTPSRCDEFNTCAEGIREYAA